MKVEVTKDGGYIIDVARGIVVVWGSNELPLTADLDEFAPYVEDGITVIGSETGYIIMENRVAIVALGAPIVSWPASLLLSLTFGEQIKHALSEKHSHTSEAPGWLTNVATQFELLHSNQEG